MTSAFRRVIAAPLWAFALAAMSFASVMSTHVQAGAGADARVETGARLFRAMVAADVDLEKKTDGDGALRILVVHGGDEERARLALDLLVRRDATRAPDAIRGLPVRGEAMRVDELALSRKPASAIFIAEPLRRTALAAVIQAGALRRVIVYSPFEGDVEQGVAGGLSIEAQVRPFVNAEALRNAQVTLRDFFLKAAKVLP